MRFKKVATLTFFANSLLDECGGNPDISSLDFTFRGTLDFGDGSNTYTTPAERFTATYTPSHDESSAIVHFRSSTDTTSLSRVFSGNSTTNVVTVGRSDFTLSSSHGAWNSS